MPAEFQYTGPTIQFTVAGEDEKEQAANLELVEPSPGFPRTQDIVSEAILRQAVATVFDFTAQHVKMRFQVDGLWHAGEAMDRETGDYMLATLKKMAGLDFRERRARQEGVFTALLRKTKYKIRVVSQGVKTGERVALYLDWKKPPLETLEELGMRQSMEQQLSLLLRDPKLTMFLVTAKPGEGFTSAWRAALGACDRLTRDYYVIEEQSKVEPEVINIGTITFDASKGETAMSPIPDLLLKEPNVLAFTDLPDGKAVDQIINLSRDHELPVFTRIPGKHAIDATLRVLVLKPDREHVASHLTGVLAMRLVRKLCEKCRVPFKPHPQLLQKLGLPPGRIAQLYKPFIYRPGMVDADENEIEPCRTCRGLGYRGRTGIFELLRMNDDLRKTLVAKPKLETLASIAAQHGHISLKQEGIVLVARGVTSLEELQRVLQA